MKNIEYNRLKDKQKELLNKYNSSKSKNNKSKIYEEIMEIEEQLENGN
jgi:hypothetical protein